MRLEHGSSRGSITRFARGDLAIGERKVGERPRRRGDGRGVESGVTIEESGMTVFMGFFVF